MENWKKDSLSSYFFQFSICRKITKINVIKFYQILTKHMCKVDTIGGVIGMSIFNGVKKIGKPTID